jgi:hypothetical protein
MIEWHETMTIRSFELDQLFTAHVPLLVTFCHGSQKALSSKRQKCVDVGQQKDKACDWQRQLKVLEATAVETTVLRCTPSKERWP